MGSDDLDLNEEEMALVTCKFKKIFKKVGKSIKKYQQSKEQQPRPSLWVFQMWKA